MQSKYDVIYYSYFLFQMEDDTLSPDARAEDPDPDDDFIHDVDQGRGYIYNQKIFFNRSTNSAAFFALQ